MRDRIRLLEFLKLFLDAYYTRLSKIKSKLDNIIIPVILKAGLLSTIDDLRQYLQF